MWRDVPSRYNFLHLEWPYSNINLGPKIWRSFLRISSRCWKKRRRRIHTSFKLDNYSNQTWQSAVSLFTKATRKAACEQASKWRGVKIKKNSPSETTRAWPEKKKRGTCRLSFDVAHSPTYNYPPRRVGGGAGGELSLRKYVVQSACRSRVSDFSKWRAQCSSNWRIKISILSRKYCSDFLELAILRSLLPWKTRLKYFFGMKCPAV